MKYDSKKEVVTGEFKILSVASDTAVLDDGFKKIELPIDLLPLSVKDNDKVIVTIETGDSHNLHSSKKAKDLLNEILS